MAQNVTINGQNYSAVPAVQIPKTGGGTAQFTDVSDTTAVAADVNSGKYIYLANGSKVQGSQNIYSITENLTQVTSNNNSSRILGGTSFVSELTPTEGYLITSVTVMMGEVDITNTAFTGDTGSGGGQSNIFTITENLTNVSSTNIAEKVVENGSFYARITPSSDYLITSLAITMGGVDVTSQVFTEDSGGGGGGSPTLQNKSVTPSESTQAVTADSGYDGLGTVSVGAIDSNYVGSGVSRKSSSDLTASGATVTAPAGYYESSATKTVASGTEGTPTATKGTVSNHYVSVTPAVTNSAGYISGGTKTGTAVTVTASELASGNKEITANGTNIDVVGYSTVSVAVPSSGSSKNVQIAQGVNRVATTSYTAVSGQSITVSKTGTYDVYWTGFRSSTGGTNGSQLYIGSTAYGSAQTTFSNHGQSIHLSNVSLTQNQTVSVYARARGTNYYMYVGNLTIIEA